MSSPVFCLSDSFIDRDVALLRTAIRRFIAEAEVTRSIDDYVILLKDLVLEIEKCRTPWMSDYDPREILRKVLSCAEVIKVLSPLADRAEDVKYLVNTDFRHSPLRPYLDLITESLSGTPSSKKLEVIRPPIRELEGLPGVELKSNTRIPLYMPGPVKVTDRSIPAEDKGGVIRRVLGYGSLIVLLVGISYFGYALLVKYGLIEPLPWIPPP